MRGCASFRSSSFGHFVGFIGAEGGGMAGGVAGGVAGACASRGPASRSEAVNGSEAASSRHLRRTTGTELVGTVHERSAEPQRLGGLKVTVVRRHHHDLARRQVEEVAWHPNDFTSVPMPMTSNRCDISFLSGVNAKVGQCGGGHRYRHVFSGR